MELKIDRQEVKDNATLINADIVNHNYYDNLFKFCCNKAESEYPEDNRLKNIINVMQLILNQDGLKRRFGGEQNKYEQLIEFCRCGEKNRVFELDDGFKSVIACIYKVASKFSVEKDEEKKAALCINSEELKKFLNVNITDTGLEIKYTEKVNSLAVYRKVKCEAERLVEELSPYIQCAIKYGNFFQFAHIYLKPNEEMPFLTEPVKFKVSNKIIPNLIRPLYGDKPECGLREIVQNALDACKEYKKETLSDSNESYVRIDVEMNATHKRIIVRDNGIGMTKDILLNKYFVVGESSKKDSDIDVIGQFGIGALAAFLLGNHISVRTKNERENIMYQFSYELNPQETESGNIDVMICKDADFLHGTEVCIDLRDDLSEWKEEKLRKKLKLDEWYGLTKIPIEYRYNGEEYTLKSYEGEEYRWETLEHNLTDTEVKYCLECENDTAYMNAAQIIYNGLMLPERYTFRYAGYIRFYPYIYITSTNHDIKLNLERTKITSGLEPILESLKQTIIAYGEEELRKDTAEIVTADGQILRHSYYNKYIKNIPLFFTRNGFGIFSKKALGSLQKERNIKGIMRFYGVLRQSVDINDLRKDRIYVFYDEVVDKTKVSYFIEKENGTKYISPGLIKKYFLNVVDARNGLNRGAMIALYHALGIDIDGEKTVGELWADHNIRRNQGELDTKDVNDRINHLIIGKNADEDFQAIIEKYHPKLLCYTEGIDNHECICEDIDVGIVKPDFKVERTV